MITKVYSIKQGDIYFVEWLERGDDYLRATFNEVPKFRFS